MSIEQVPATKADITQLRDRMDKLEKLVERLFAEVFAEKGIKQMKAGRPKTGVKESKIKGRTKLPISNLYTVGSKLASVIGEARMKGKEKVLSMPPRKDGWLSRWVERMQERERRRETLRARAKRIARIKGEVRRANIKAGAIRE